MSSTNRGRERVLDDFYETPYWTTQLLHNYLGYIDEPILEPAVGKGKIVDVLKENGYKNITGLDLNSKFNPDICEDYLSWVPDKEYKTIITNPPYTFAAEYVHKCLEDVAEGGMVALLLRLNFLESKKRYPFWKEHMPSRIYVLAERPKFYLGKTDSIAYAWYVWFKDAMYENEETTLTIISKQDLES